MIDPQPSLDVSLFPATYHFSTSSKVKIIGSMSALLLLAFAGRAHLSLASPVSTKILALSGFGIAVFGALDFFGQRVTLYSDRIEAKFWFSKKVWNRADVAGKAARRMFFLKIPVLVRRNNGAYYFCLPTEINEDAAWHAWMDSIPDFDAKKSR